MIPQIDRSFSICQVKIQSRASEAIRLLQKSRIGGTYETVQRAL